MAKLLYLSAFQRDHGSFVCMLCWHGSKAASVCFRTETGLLFFDLTGVFQKHSYQCGGTDRHTAGVCEDGDGSAFPSERTAGMMLVLIMLAVLLANTVFYKEKKRLLTRYDADGRKEVICYIHHQDGQKH